LGGLDVLVFTGGVGEHDPAVRAQAAAGLAFLGVGIDAKRNRDASISAADADADISADGAAVRTLRIIAREDIEIAGQVRATLRWG
jgi:acetate kinase